MISLRRSLCAVLLTTGLLVSSSVAAAAGDATAPPGTPTAVSTSGVSTAGPLFFGPLADGHGCSASVVDTPFHNVIVTAAHCISGTGAGISFVPGYDRGATPFGAWTTTKVWLSSHWLARQDPHADVAFLAIAPQRIGGRTVNVEDVTGAEVFGFTPAAGTTVTDPAYPAGVDDAPITCTAPLSLTDAFPTFNCYGYFGGTSGSPFLVQRLGRPSVVVGVIGGLHQGGCYDWNSFSSVFGLDTFHTYVRAAFGGSADIAPVAGSDGC